jgi:hypothetical protein
MTQPRLEENSVLIDLFSKNVIVDPLAGNFNSARLPQAVNLE